MEPGQKVAQYKLLAKIGEGGMGVVFMAEQHEPAGALDERDDGGTAGSSDDQVSFPVAWNRPVVDDLWALLDGCHRVDEPWPSSVRVGIGLAGCSPAAKLVGQLALEGSAEMDVDRLVDGLGAHAHLGRVGEVLAEAMADLFRRPSQLQLLMDVVAKLLVPYKLRTPRPVPALDGDTVRRVRHVAPLRDCVSSELSADR